MRLACPNCDARYEVADDAIPEGGRDVQCSNCGHAWFQLSPDAERALAEEAALYGDDLPPPPVPAAPALSPAPAAAPVPPPLAPASSDYDEEYLDEAPRRSFAPPPAAPALEESVLSVLREEADRETEARRAEAQRQSTRRAEAEGQMQTQPDLGMAEPTPGLTPAQRRMAMLKGENPDAAPPAPARPTARRDLLPDVEEINSTLQPGQSRHDPDEEVDALPDLTRGNSFRTGFLLAVFVLFVAAVIYLAAGSIAALVPALKAPLDSYVGFVDGIRLWLNGLMDSTTAAINGTAG